MEALAGLLTGVPLDWFILGGILIVVALDVLRSGLGRANAIAIALVLAVVLNALVLKTAFLSMLPIVSTSVYAPAGIFLALTILLYFLVRRMGLEYVDGGMGEPIQALLAGVSVVVVVAVVWLSTPALQVIWHPNNTIASIFAEQFFLLWLLGAYAVLAFARG